MPGGCFSGSCCCWTSADAARRSSELLLAVAVVCCGFYESVAEGREWSALNTVVLLVHCYFNIYTR